MHKYTLDGRRVKATRTNYFTAVTSAPAQKLVTPNANRLGLWFGFVGNNEVTQLMFTVIITAKANDGSTNMLGVISNAQPYLYLDVHDVGPDLLGEIYVTSPGGTPWPVAAGEVAANETE